VVGPGLRDRRGPRWRDASFEESPLPEFVAGTQLAAVGGSNGATFVPTMRPTHLRDRDDSPDFWRLDWARLWRILLQAEMRAARSADNGSTYTVQQTSQAKPSISS
jgi:hypothetical protein